jgi:tetrahydromethanopterin S-methyltransferase subunit G
MAKHVCLKDDDIKEIKATLVTINTKLDAKVESFISFQSKIMGGIGVLTFIIGLSVVILPYIFKHQ